MASDKPITWFAEHVINTITNVITYLFIIYLLQLFVEREKIVPAENVAVLNAVTDENGEYQTSIPCDKVLSVVSSEGLATYECVEGYAKVVTFTTETDTDAGKYEEIDMKLVHKHGMKRVSRWFTLTYVIH